MHERSSGRASTKEISDEIKHLRMEDRRGLKVFAGGGGSGENKDARADDGADSERC